MDIREKREHGTGMVAPNPEAFPTAEAISHFGPPIHAAKERRRLGPWYTRPQAAQA
jgi:hypothetical protein